MSGASRVLVLTPDFPPAIGGIQTLVHRVVSGLTRLEPRVVTVDHPEAGRFDAASGIDTVRVAASGSHRTRLLGLNARALLEARRFRPELVLAAHIVCGPTARLLRLPYDLYVYADEVSGSPLLSRLAMGGARQILTISRHTEDLARRAGGPPDRMRLVLPGVDLPAAAERAPSMTPTMLTVASLIRRYKGHDVVLDAMPRIIAAVPACAGRLSARVPFARSSRRGAGRSASRNTSSSSAG